jgi:hypothetical protein
MKNSRKPNVTTEAQALGLRWTRQHRAQTVTDKKKQASQRACRGRQFDD